MIFFDEITPSLLGAYEGTGENNSRKKIGGNKFDFSDQSGKHLSTWITARRLGNGF